MIILLRDILKQKIAIFKDKASQFTATVLHLMSLGVHMKQFKNW